MTSSIINNVRIYGNSAIRNIIIRFVIDYNHKMHYYDAQMRIMMTAGRKVHLATVILASFRTVARDFITRRVVYARRSKQSVSRCPGYTGGARSRKFDFVCEPFFQSVLSASWQFHHQRVNDEKGGTQERVRKREKEGKRQAGGRCREERDGIVRDKTHAS